MDLRYQTVNLQQDKTHFSVEKNGSVMGDAAKVLV